MKSTQALPRIKSYTLRDPRINLQNPLRLHNLYPAATPHFPSLSALYSSLQQDASNLGVGHLAVDMLPVQHSERTPRPARQVAFLQGLLGACVLQSL